MIARLALLLLAAALALAGCEAPEADLPRDWPAPSPALWEVGPRERPVAWLFGTVHALPAGLAWRTPRLEQALAGADLLLVEIADLEDRDTARRAYEGLSRGTALPPLSRRVAEADRPRLAALLEAGGANEEDFAERETWAAALSLAAASRRYDPALGVDRALIAEASGRIEGLETHESQFRRFDRLSPVAQAELLASVADDVLAADQEARIEAWLTGDLARLEALSAGRLLAHAELREALLAARNRAWVERIVALVERGERPLVAVGAGHMLGADGLPALLAARGFELRRVQ